MTDMVDPTSEAVKHTLYALQGRHLNERVVAHALNVALKHLTDDDLLNAPGGHALLAEGKSAGEVESIEQLSDDFDRWAPAYREEGHMDSALEKVIGLHRKSDYARLVGFPRANEEEHYCMEDQKTWPCPTVTAATSALEGLHND